jgi:uncharacterized protein (TIRG00374 family)
VLLVLLVVGLTGIMAIQNRRLSLAVLSYGERLPFLARIAHLMRTFYESSYTLLQWRPLLLAVSIGFISWSGECTALYFVFTGLGIAASPALLIKATFILSVASLIGSASGLPGGLGTADGSMLGLIRLLVTTSATLGGAATLLIRLCTLWFGLGLGVIALLIFRSVTPPDSLAQHTDVSAGREDGWEDQKQNTNNALPESEGQRGLQAASANMGDKAE